MKARAEAFRILRRVERKGAFASLLLQRLPSEWDAADTALTTEIVYGALRFKLRDEHVLARLADRPMKEIDPDLAILFRIAAHQILRLDRIPDRAAVHEAVEAARRAPGGGRWSAKRREAGARFMNAVLRRLCREKEALPLPAPPDPESDPEAVAQAWEILHSHPAWMIRRWIERFGTEQTEALLRTNNTPARPSVRVETARSGVEEVIASLAREGIESIRSERAPGFLRITRGAPQRSEACRRGFAYIQDEASGLVPELVAPAPGALVLDACAAPGGKATALARMAGEDGSVLAADRYPARMGLVASNARRLQVPNIRLLIADMSLPPFNDESFDAVLVDAPCSGSGVFRRDVESRYRLQEEDLAKLARAQRSILEGVAPLVRRGGRLVYAVCSVEPEEGEDLVAAFLADHEEFTRAEPPGRLREQGDLLGLDGALRTLPHLHDIDGFYAAALLRTPY